MIGSSTRTIPFVLILLIALVTSVRAQLTAPRAAPASGCAGDALGRQLRFLAISAEAPEVRDAARVLLEGDACPDGGMSSEEIPADVPTSSGTSSFHAPQGDLRDLQRVGEARDRAVDVSGRYFHDGFHWNPTHLVIDRDRPSEWRFTAHRQMGYGHYRAGWHTIVVDLGSRRAWYETEGQELFMANGNALRIQLSGL